MFGEISEDEARSILRQAPSQENASTYIMLLLGIGVIAFGIKSYLKKKANMPKQPYGV